ncbi:DMT family transporter [Salisediminibacterium selenitireducens]|uniref:EamA domain-containing protein n=1 Tax=Bacillus selenitireducens (strain ATCC 700615 / DSM 15326 / MLS10) TaxID=439292 RepID=D6XUF8_BACIE|nr:DMT family transporter [Salisediminibacterium selenitireducens]ADH99444.1 protein of unknown function DUF6 transmembrane [[Bacillus] selenitireducens MLS10]
MKHNQTYLMLTVVMIFWGLNVVAVKYLVEHFSPVMMQGMRIGAAGLVLITILFLMHDISKVTVKQWYYVTAAALFGQVLHHALVARGLQLTTASNASLILGLIPITTAILSTLILKDALSRLQYGGVLIALSGVSLVVFEGSLLRGIQIAEGDLLIFAGMLVQAVSFIIIRKATLELNPKQMTGMMLLIGAAVLSIYGWLTEPRVIPEFPQASMAWGVFFASAVFATGLGHLMYNIAIRNIGAAQSAVFNNLVPLFALIGATLFLNESVTLRHGVGFLLIVTGVLLGTGYIEQKIMKNRQSFR